MRSSPSQKSEPGLELGSIGVSGRIERRKFQEKRGRGEEVIVSAQKNIYGK